MNPLFQPVCASWAYDLPGAAIQSEQRNPIGALRSLLALVVLSTTVAMMGTTTAQAALTIDWSSGLITSPSPHGTYVFGGVTVTLATSANVSYNFSSGAINSFNKNNQVNGHYTITFSQPVDFSTGFGDLNIGGESVGNFSVAPSSSVINALHLWNGATLSYNGSNNKDTYSTFTWAGITSLSFDHIYPPNAGEFRILDGTFSAVPEPSTVIAGALLLLPFGASTLRILRNRKQA